MENIDNFILGDKVKEEDQHEAKEYYDYAEKLSKKYFSMDKISEVKKQTEKGTIISQEL